MKNVNQQGIPDKKDPDQLLSQHLNEDHSSKQDNLYYKEFAGVLIFALIVACIFLAVIFEP